MNNDHPTLARYGIKKQMPSHWDLYEKIGVAMALITALILIGVSLS